MNSRSELVNSIGRKMKSREEIRNAPWFPGSEFPYYFTLLRWRTQVPLSSAHTILGTFSYLLTEWWRLLLSLLFSACLLAFEPLLLTMGRTGLGWWCPVSQLFKIYPKWSAMQCLLLLYLQSRTFCWLQADTYNWLFVVSSCKLEKLILCKLSPYVYI